MIILNLSETNCRWWFIKKENLENELDLLFFFGTTLKMIEATVLWCVNLISFSITKKVPSGSSFWQYVTHSCVLDHICIETFCLDWWILLVVIFYNTLHSLPELSNLARNSIMLVWQILRKSRFSDYNSVQVCNFVAIYLPQYMKLYLFHGNTAYYKL